MQQIRSNLTRQSVSTAYVVNVSRDEKSVLFLLMPEFAVYSEKCPYFMCVLNIIESLLLLTCIEPPRINVTSSTSSTPQVVVGSTMTMHCHVTGVPSPDIEWLNNGRPLDHADPRIRVGADGRQLDIINSELSDAGRYTCIAKNDAGIVDRDFDLEVLGMSVYCFYQPRSDSVAKVVLLLVVSVSWCVYLSSRELLNRLTRSFEIHIIVTFLW